MTHNRFKPYGEPERTDIEFSPTLSITLDMRIVSAMQKCSETPPEDARRDFDMTLIGLNRRQGRVTFRTILRPAAMVDVTTYFQT